MMPLTTVLTRAQARERIAMSIYYDDPEPDLGWDDLGDSIKEKILHVADVALDAIFCR